jgi:DNA topoisomerase-3
MTAALQIARGDDAQAAELVELDNRACSAAAGAPAHSAALVTSAIEHGEGVDRYRTTGTCVDSAGWRVLESASPQRKQSEDSGEEKPLPPGLAANMSLQVLEALNLRKATRPPRPLTEAPLLGAMESAGRALEDRELADAMREGGLCTPATRASIIVRREKRALCATEKGIALVAAVHSDAKSPIMTGRWESELGRIERGEGLLEDFLRGIERYVADVVAQVRSQAPAAPSARPSTAAKPAAAPMVAPH